MKRKFFLICILLSLFCYTEAMDMNDRVESVMNDCFMELIPHYYNGQEDFSKEKKEMYLKYGVSLLGDIFSEFTEGNSLIFNFYYRLDEKRQDHQVIKITEYNVNGKLYEYWIMNMSDHGIPYNYSNFYLTEAESLQGERTIIDCSKHYNDTYKLTDDKILDLTFNNLVVLYQAEPWLSRQSFKGTKYEDIIVKWKGDTPYLRKMNLFEKIYFTSLRKSKR